MSVVATGATGARELDGSRDPQTGDVFVPPRALSVDGALRRLEDIRVPAVGVLVDVVDMGGRCFAHLDLDAGPRLMVELGPGPHETGATYQLTLGAERFARA